MDLHNCTWCKRESDKVTIIPTLRSSFVHKDTLAGESLMIPLCHHCVAMSRNVQRSYKYFVALLEEIETTPEPTPENTWIDELERWMSTL